jgi:hypothetical protein
MQMTLEEFRNLKVGDVVQQIDPDPNDPVIKVWQIMHVVASAAPTPPRFLVSTVIDAPHGKGLPLVSGEVMSWGNFVSPTNETSESLKVKRMGWMTVWTLPSLFLVVVRKLEDPEGWTLCAKAGPLQFQPQR